MPHASIRSQAALLPSLISHPLVIPVSRFRFSPPYSDPQSDHSSEVRVVAILALPLFDLHEGGSPACREHGLSNY